MEFYRTVVGQFLFYSESRGLSFSWEALVQFCAGRKSDNLVVMGIIIHYGDMLTNTKDLFSKYKLTNEEIKYWAMGYTVFDDLSTKQSLPIELIELGSDYSYNHIPTFHFPLIENKRFHKKFFRECKMFIDRNRKNISGARKNMWYGTCTMDFKNSSDAIRLIQFRLELTKDLDLPEKILICIDIFSKRIDIWINEWINNDTQSLCMFGPLYFCIKVLVNVNSKRKKFPLTMVFLSVVGSKIHNYLDFREKYDLRINEFMNAELDSMLNNIIEYEHESLYLIAFLLPIMKINNRCSFQIIKTMATAVLESSSLSITKEHLKDQLHQNIITSSINLISTIGNSNV